LIGDSGKRAKVGRREEEFLLWDLGMLMRDCCFKGKYDRCGLGRNGYKKERHDK
jgi:hypothetical protein